MTLCALFTLINLGLLALPSCFGQAIRMPTSYSFYPGFGRGLWAKLQADGQNLKMYVDSGSGEIIFIWKDWFEEQFYPTYCNHFGLGCYKASTPRKRGGPTASFRFADDVTVAVFQHEGRLTFGDHTVDNMIFGLTYDQHPPPDVNVALNFLGLAESALEDFPSLMEQLVRMQPSPVASDTYALYLRRPLAFSLPPNGEIILGSGNPSLYHGALTFAEMTDVKKRMVNLAMFHVGSGIATIGVNQRVLFDTGTTYMYIPRLYVNGLIKDISEESDTTFNYDFSTKKWFFNCLYIKDLPTISFGFGTNGEATMTFSYHNYVYQGGGLCALLFTADTSNTWTFPGSFLTGNYIEFQPSQQRVGFAPLRFWLNTKQLPEGKSPYEILFGRSYPEELESRLTRINSENDDDDNMDEAIENLKKQQQLIISEVLQDRERRDSPQDPRLIIKQPPVGSTVIRVSSPGHQQQDRQVYEVVKILSDGVTVYIRPVNSIVNNDDELDDSDVVREHSSNLKRFWGASCENRNL